MVLKRDLASCFPSVEEAYPWEQELSAGQFFVAASPAMRKVRLQAELLADINAPVLILGESGTGKEVTARLIHELSPRADRRFLKVNCAALPADLLESELFGYERGAFTGAVRTKPGKFELCNKGTILLDEIGEMPVALQAKLLHVLQDKQFFRLGGEITVDVDVRILAATNVNIDQAIADRKLREDLFYRLAAFMINLPPLRERAEDIPILLQHFMNRLAEDYVRPPLPIPPALLEACQHYSWPGNLRELENFVKRYLVMGNDAPGRSELQSKLNPILTEPPPAQTGELQIRSAIASSAADDPNNLKTRIRNVKEMMERNAIAVALAKTHWNRKQAARTLGISYRGLLHKIQKYQLRPLPVTELFELLRQQVGP